MPGEHVNDRVIELLRCGPACILTGAGISTDSGIPDYRGPEQRGRPARPITYREFVSSAASRRRYWARSAVGWAWMEQREPNWCHYVVAQIERTGHSTGLITQNVDGLHSAAGSRRIVELHGALRSVVCLECGRPESRAGLQERIMVQNPGWFGNAGTVAPDGDVDLEEEVTDSFRVPACLQCGGTIKPDIVFFGESVPQPRVRDAFSMLESARLLLVLGSSLTVYSGYRFVAAAVKSGKPVIVITDGPTRADPVATVKLTARLDGALRELAHALNLSCEPVAIRVPRGARR